MALLPGALIKRYGKTHLKVDGMDSNGPSQAEIKQDRKRRWFWILLSAEWCATFCPHEPWDFCKVTPKAHHNSSVICSESLETSSGSCYTRLQTTVSASWDVKSLSAKRQNWSDIFWDGPRKSLDLNFFLLNEAELLFVNLQQAALKWTSPWFWIDWCVNTKGRPQNTAIQILNSISPNYIFHIYYLLW